MKPNYNLNINSKLGWNRTIEDILLRSVLFIIFGAIILLYIFTRPPCPECNQYIDETDVYCSRCGHQLRTMD